MSMCLSGFVHFGDMSHFSIGTSVCSNPNSGTFSVLHKFVHFGFVHFGFVHFGLVHFGFVHFGDLSHFSIGAQIPTVAFSVSFTSARNATVVI